MAVTKEICEKSMREIIGDNCKTDGSLQAYHTPYNICKSIIQKLTEYIDICDESIDILIMFNLEFVSVLIEDMGVNPRNITFMSDSEQRKNIAEYYYNVNTIYKEKNSLIENVKIGEKIMRKQFDVVIGNPPYNTDLHLQFFNMAIECSKKYVAFVHPSYWMFSKKDTKWPERIKEKIKDYKKDFALFNGNPVFGIGLFMPCVISLIDKSIHEEKITICNELDDSKYIYKDIWGINKFGNISEYYSLLKNISAHAKKDNFENYLNNSEKRKPKKSNFYINIAGIRGNHDDNNSNRLWKDDFYTILTKEDIVENEVNKRLTIGFKNKKQAENCLEYMKTKFCRFCLALIKLNVQLSRGEMILIPWLDFSQKWTEEKLRKYFNITKKEWEFIDKVIPDYY